MKKTEENEIDKLLNELKVMQSKGKSVPNNSDTWSKIQKNDWEGLGFYSKEEMQQWILDNPYANM